MGYRRLAKIAFEEGCGIRFADALRSDEYRELKKREHLIYKRFPVGSSERWDLNLCHFDYTRMMHAYIKNGEKVVKDIMMVEICKKTLTEQAMLRFLGKQLVLSAQKQLPDKSIELAQKMRETNDHNARTNILMDFFRLMIEIKSCNSTTNADEVNEYSWVTMAMKELGYKGVLPKAFGKYGAVGSTAPHCLGMAILLTAWARLANINVLLIQSLEMHDGLIWANEGIVSEAMLKTIERCKLETNPEFVSGLKENITNAKAHRHMVTDFHSAVVLEVSEYLWFYFDPYIGKFGWFYPQIWSAIHQTLLLKHDVEVLPGLALTVHDNGFIKKWFGNRTRNTQILVEDAKSLDKALKKAPRGREAFETYIWDLPQIRNLIFLTKKCLGSKKPKRSIIKGMFGWQSSQRVSDLEIEAKWTLFETDDKFYRSCLKRLAGLLLIRAKKLYYAEAVALAQMGSYIPPSFELSNPEFMIALLVLNHLNCWAVKEDNLGLFCLKHSSSQVLWHQVVSNIDIQQNQDNFLVQSSVRLMKSLDHLHARNKFKLNQLMEEGVIK